MVFIHAARLLCPLLIGTFPRTDTGRWKWLASFWTLHVPPRMVFNLSSTASVAEMKIKFISPVAGSWPFFLVCAAVTRNLCRCCSSTHLRDIIELLPAATTVPGKPPKNVNVNVTCISIPFYFIPPPPRCVAAQAGLTARDGGRWRWGRGGGRT